MVMVLANSQSNIGQTFGKTEEFGGTEDFTVNNGHDDCFSQSLYLLIKTTNIFPAHLKHD